jgi:hypothetical protein
MVSSSSIRQQSVCSSVKLRGTRLNSHLPLPSNHSLIPIYHNNIHPFPVLRTRFHLTVVVPKASAGSYSPANDDGVSLGTMKLPINLDLQRFESLLFQVNPFTHFIVYCYVNYWQTSLKLAYNCEVSGESVRSNNIGIVS